MSYPLVIDAFPVTAPHPLRAAIVNEMAMLTEDIPPEVPNDAADPQNWVTHIANAQGEPCFRISVPDLFGQLAVSQVLRDLGLKEDLTAGPRNGMLESRFC